MNSGACLAGMGNDVPWLDEAEESGHLWWAQGYWPATLPRGGPHLFEHWSPL